MAAGASIAPYLITAGSTLAGVAITGVLAEYRERRRAREDRERELDRLVEERLKWLRQERRQSYAGLIDLGYQAANLLLEAASRLFDREGLDSVMELWPLLDRLRDSISARVVDVELVGSDEVINAAHRLRHAFRRAPNVLMSCAQSLKHGDERHEELSAQLSPRVRWMFEAVHTLVEAAKGDLRVDVGQP